MICFPNAKINVGLNIGHEGSEGLHDIQSIFIPIKLCDILEAVECVDQENKVSITYSGITKKIENDLCLKAYNLLDSDFILPKIKVHLHKKIPFGAGLGGGSSDAVHMLILLNDLFKLNLSKLDLLKYSKKIGSDCSFFVYNKPSFVFGSGDLVKTKEINLFKKKNKKLFLLLVKPINVNISTSEVFSNFRKINRKKVNQTIDYKSIDNLGEFKNRIFNELEDVSFKMYPELSEIKKYMYQNKAIYSSMSGSGSVIYGIFSESININNFKNIFKNHFIWIEDLNF